jgi:hypothetical protein
VPGAPGWGMTRHPKLGAVKEPQVALSEPALRRFNFLGIFQGADSVESINLGQMLCVPEYGYPCLSP